MVTSDYVPTPAISAYCLKCRTHREMQGPEAVTMKNGKPATKGTCPEFGTGMYKIGKSRPVEATA